MSNFFQKSLHPSVLACLQYVEEPIDILKEGGKKNSISFSGENLKLERCCVICYSMGEGGDSSITKKDFSRYF